MINLRKSALIFAIILIGFQSGGAQAVKRLSVGDKIPDIFFGKVFNYPGSTMKLSDLKGKSLVIDIWSKYCTACIAAFPKLQEISEMYPDRLQVLLVTQDSQDDYNQLKGKSPIVKSNKLPVIVEDSIIRKMFPSNGIPWQVWIDSTLTVRAINNGNETTNESIASFLNGKVALNLQRNLKVDFDIQKSLLSEGNGRNISQLDSYSFFMDSLDVIRSSIVRVKDSVTGKLTGIRMVNVILPRACVIAFGNIPIDIQIDSFRLRRFCYELRLPREEWGSVNKMVEYMKADLSRQFNVSFNIEKRSIKTFKLTRINGKGKDIITKFPSEESVDEYLNNRIILKNRNIVGLIDQLRKIRSEVFVLDKSIILPEYVDIELDIPKNASLKTINEQLESYNLTLIEEVKEVDMLIVK
jgi:thiol-disulfide isomerase/thioredoxin